MLEECLVTGISDLGEKFCAVPSKTQVTKSTRINNEILVLAIINSDGERRAKWHYSLQLMFIGPSS
jgi:hypothetical protein